MPQTGIDALNVQERSILENHGLRAKVSIAPLLVHSSESSNESVPSDSYKYVTPFLDHEEGNDIFVNSRSILRIRIESTKVPWTELRFEKKSQSNPPYANGSPSF